MREVVSCVSQGRAKRCVGIKGLVRGHVADMHSSCYGEVSKVPDSGCYALPSGVGRIAPRVEQFDDL